MRLSSATDSSGEPSMDHHSSEHLEVPLHTLAWFPADSRCRSVLEAIVRDRELAFGRQRSLSRTITSPVP